MREDLIRKSGFQDIDGKRETLKSAMCIQKPQGSQCATRRCAGRRIVILYAHSFPGNVGKAVWTRQPSGNCFVFTLANLPVLAGIALEMLSMHGWQYICTECPHAFCSTFTLIVFVPMYKPPVCCSKGLSKRCLDSTLAVLFLPLLVVVCFYHKHSTSKPGLTYPCPPQNGPLSRPMIGESIQPAALIVASQIFTKLPNKNGYITPIVWGP